MMNEEGEARDASKYEGKSIKKTYVLDQINDKW